MPACEHSGFEMNSKTVLLSVGVVLLLVGALAGYLYGVNSMPATTTTTTTSMSTVSTVPHAYDEVAVSYANHLLDLTVINPGAFFNGYEGNATVEWKGSSGGCDGNYTGTGEIASLFEGLLANDSYLHVFNENQTIAADGNHWVVNSTFSLVGNSTADKSIVSPFVGFFNGTITAQDSYVYDANALAWSLYSGGSHFLITNETWNFLRLDEEPVYEQPFPVTC
jgi:hypothetical protein